MSETGGLPAQERVIVFGGAGFIGSHLLAGLLQDGHWGRLYSVDTAEPRIRVPDVNYISHDLRNPIPRNLCGAGPALIFNLAAVHVTPGHEDWEYYWTNILGAKNVCQFASEIGAQEIVFTSSISVYGPSESEKNEDSELEPASAYGRSKLLAEEVHEVWRKEQSEARRLTIVRPAVIYGPGECGNFTRLANLLKKGRFVYPGRKNTIKSCGYVKDLVSAMLFMRARGLSKTIFNFCYPERYTTEDICSAFCDVAGFKRPNIVVPIKVMLMGGMAFEIPAKLGVKTGVNRDRVRKLFHSTNIVPKRLQEAGYKYAFDLRSSLADWRKSTATGEFI